MIYHEMTIGGETYKLRLTAYNVQKLEKETGKKLPDLMEGLDSLGELLALFKRALAPEYKKMTEQQVAELYDQYVDDGGDYEAFVQEIMEVFCVSGFLSKKRLKLLQIKMELSAKETQAEFAKSEKALQKNS